jgi:hypothetical protein
MKAVKNIKKIGLIFALLAASFSSTSYASSTRAQEADSLISTDHTKSYGLPGSSDTLDGIAAANTLTNKSISGASNTLTLLPVGVNDLQETPSGTVNGSNVTFTLANTPPSSTTVILMLDGLVQIQGSGNDYTISGSTITMLTAPATGQKLYATYSKY